MYFNYDDYYYYKLARLLMHMAHTQMFIEICIMNNTDTARCQLSTAGRGLREWKWSKRWNTHSHPYTPNSSKRFKIDTLSLNCTLSPLTDVKATEERKKTNRREKIRTGKTRRDNNDISTLWRHSCDIFLCNAAVFFFSSDFIGCHFHKFIQNRCNK